LKESKVNPADNSIAFFISPHGYGHAARACAVMAAMHELNPSIRFEILQQSLNGFLNNQFPELSRITVC
jgi:hypothetical protein